MRQSTTDAPVWRKWLVSNRRRLQLAGCCGALLLLLRITRTADAAWIQPRLLLLVIAGLALGSAITWATSWRRNTRATVPRGRGGVTQALLAGALIYFCSSAVLDPWFFPTRWVGAAGLLEAPWRHGAARSLLLAIPIAWLWPVAARRQAVWATVCIACVGWLLWECYQATGFQMIYRTDHPSFVYRFWAFKETFPRPDFYDPHWNAGMPVPFLVATGIWAVGPLLLPWLQWIPIEQLYTPALAVIYLGVLPTLAWFSLKWIKARPRACWLAVLLALATTQRFWVHLLHYGTIGALFSMSMALPLAACWYRFLYIEAKPSRTTLAGLLLGGLILLTWPGALTIALAFLLVTLLHIRRLFPHKWIWVLAGGAILFIVLLPLALVPLRYSDIDSFTQVTAHQPWWNHFRHGLGVMAHNLRSTNALIVVFGFIGGFFLRRASARWFFGPLILALLLLSGWGEEVKALLQTERLIIPAALVAILPTAWWLDRITTIAHRATNYRVWSTAVWRTVTAWVVAILLLSVYQAARTWGGRGMAPFQTRPDYMDTFIAWIQDHVPEDGRVMFAGRAVHAYGGGKVAALPMFTGREMMATDFYGFSPRLVEYEYPPRIFRQAGSDGWFDFKEIHNITHVATWHDYWQDRYDAEPERYRRVHDIKHIAIYEVQRPSSLFLHGRGRVKAQFDRFDIRLDELHQPTVIKYNWADGLVAEPPVELFAFEVGYDTRLIGFNPGTNRTLTIRYRP